MTALSDMLCHQSFSSACRPTNRIMLAQRIAVPQACVGTITLIIHVPVTYLAVRWFALIGAAWAYNLTSATMIALMWTYVGLAGLGPRVWGQPSTSALKVRIYVMTFLPSPPLTAFFDCQIRQDVFG